MRRARRAHRRLSRTSGGSARGTSGRRSGRLAGEPGSPSAWWTAASRRTCPTCAGQCSGWQHHRHRQQRSGRRPGADRSRHWTRGTDRRPGQRRWHSRHRPGSEDPAHPGFGRRRGRQTRGVFGVGGADRYGGLSGHKDGGQRRRPGSEPVSRRSGTSASACTPVLQDAVAYALQHNVVVVAGAGNVLPLLGRADQRAEAGRLACGGAGGRRGGPEPDQAWAAQRAAAVRGGERARRRRSSLPRPRSARNDHRAGTGRAWRAAFVAGVAALVRSQVPVAALVHAWCSGSSTPGCPRAARYPTTATGMGSSGFPGH